MKKILAIIISLVLVIGLVGCQSPTDTTDLENRLDLLELSVEEQQNKIDVLEDFYRSVVPTVGLNGQTDYYVNYGDEQYMSMMSYELLKTEKDYLDKAKFPDYIWNNDEEYISVDDLVNKLTMKYFGLESEGLTGFQFKIKMDSSDLDITNEEFIVRACMMIMELSEYDFYTIDTTQLYFEFIAGGSQYMTVRMSLLINDNYVLHPAIFWSGLMDTTIEGITYDVSLLEAMYDQYILDETFSGYVLPNYK